MRKPIQLIAAGMAAIILYDLVASSLSRLVGIPYGIFSIGSLVICLAIGFFASRSHTGKSGMLAIVAGSLAGVADATLGWWISIQIGPGQPMHRLTPGIWIFTLLAVMIGHSLFSAIGYSVESRWLYRWRS